MSYMANKYCIVLYCKSCSVLIYALAVYGKITMLVFRMIEKFGGGSSDVENMIDIQFQQTAAQDKNSKFDYDFHSYGHVVIW